MKTLKESVSGHILASIESKSAKSLKEQDDVGSPGVQNSLDDELDRDEEKVLEAGTSAWFAKKRTN